MVELKTVAASVVAVLFVLLKPGIKAQPTISSYSEEDDCSTQLEEDLESQAVQSIRLRSALEKERQTIKTLEDECRIQRSQTVTATFMNSFDHFRSHHGITKVEDKIYVLNKDELGMLIKVYEDGTEFRFLTDIAINDIGQPYDIVYSSKSKSVYISDVWQKCIWVMKTEGETQLSKWLTNVNWPFTMSMSNEGHLLVLKEGELFSQLESYSLNAILIRRLRLPQDFMIPQHAVQISSGNFIILHHLRNVPGEPQVISQMTKDGWLIHRFIPRNRSEKLDIRYLSLDSDNNRLFAADRNNSQLMVLDSNALAWSQVLLSGRLNGIRKPARLFYDASKKHLFVAQHEYNVTVYKID